MSARAPPKSEPPKTKEDDSIFTKVYEGEAPDSTESNVRFAAYANRIRTLMRAGHRYIAYTSDIGESFRPVSHPYLVRAAYGVSWLYLTGDVLNEGYKAYLSNQTRLHGGHAMSSVPEFLRAGAPPSTSSSPAADKTTVVAAPKSHKPRIHSAADVGMTEEDFYDPLPKTRETVPFLEDYRAVMVQRALFQSIASMGLPAFTIHSIVKYSGRALSKHKNTVVRTWAPIGLGLAVVPALPYMFDHPVEVAVERGFEWGYEMWTGKKGISEKVKEL